MKIAYQNEVPDQELFQRFVGAAGDQDVRFGDLQYDNVCASEFVIAAYDQDELIGLGTIEQRNAQGEVMDVAVSSSYRQREVEQYIRKLLKASCRFG